MNSVWYTPCPTRPSANSFSPSPRRHMKDSLLLSSKPTGSSVASAKRSALNTIGSTYWIAHLRAAGLPAHVAIMASSSTSYVVKPCMAACCGPGSRAPASPPAVGGVEASRETEASAETPLVSSVTCPIVRPPQSRQGSLSRPVGLPDRRRSSSPKAQSYRLRQYRCQTGDYSARQAGQAL